MDEITTLYTLFKKGNDTLITGKQKIYLINTYNNIYLNKNIDELLIFCNSIISREIKQIDNLNYSETKLIIDKLHTKLKIINFGNEIGIKNLSILLNKKINSINDLTRKDYNNIIFNPNINFNHCLDNLHLIFKKEKIIERYLDYEYGEQDTEICENNTMKFLKFYDFLMLDYDNINENQLDNILTNSELNLENHLFYIYKTFNGFHLFYMTETLLHNKKETAFFMKMMNCDSWYIIYSYKNGFKIRLNKKKNRNEEYIHKFLKKCGKSKPNLKCLEYINIIDKYLNFK